MVTYQKKNKIKYQYARKVWFPGKEERKKVLSGVTDSVRARGMCSSEYVHWNSLLDVLGCSIVNRCFVGQLEKRQDKVDDIRCSLS
jgi:hypothetical protein